MKRIISFILTFAFLLTVSPFALQTDAASENTIFYVSPYGNDENVGSINSPFKTPEKARDTVRTMIAEGRLPEEGGVTICLREGVYEFPKMGFSLTEEDSGTEESPIVYCAYGDERVVFAGGVQIEQSEFRRVSEEKVLERIYDENARQFIYQYDLSEINDYDFSDYDYLKPHELILDDEVQTAARWPNTSADGSVVFAAIDSVVKIDSSYFSFKLHSDFLPRMKYWKKADWGNMAMHGFWGPDWYDQKIGVDSVRNGTIQSDILPLYSTSIAPSKSFFVYNLLPELDRPGEYYIDTENKTLYYYPDVNSGADSEFIISTLDGYICTINASNVTFRNIIFNGSRSGGVKIGTAENAVLDFCKILNTVGVGLTIGESADDTDAVKCGIRNSEIRNVTLGINMFGGETKNLKKGNCFAENNLIYNFSRLGFCYMPAIAMAGCGNTAFHNEIGRSDHMGASIGGCMNEFAYNEMYDLLRESADAGAIYMGRKITRLGNSIHHNYMHDIHISKRLTGSVFGIRAVYFDDYESGKSFTNNIIANVDGIGVISNGGSWNDISNNLFYNVKNSPVNIAVGPDGENQPFTLQNTNARVSQLIKDFANMENDTWYEKFPFLSNIWNSNFGAYKGNVVKRNIRVNSADFSLDTNVEKERLDAEYNIELQADDIFENAEKGDFRIKSDSKVYELVPGFEDIEFDKIGRYSDKAEGKVSGMLVLSPGAGNAIVSGDLKMIDSENLKVAPFIENDRVLVPIRFIAESLGAEVSWDNDTEIVSLVKGDTKVSLNIGSHLMYINGESISIDCAPMLYENRTFVPVRVVSEALGKKVDWYPSGLITIGEEEQIFDAEEDKELIRYLVERMGA